MALRALFAVAAVAALAVGLALPAFQQRAEPKSQIEQIEVGRN